MEQTNSNKENKNLYRRIQEAISNEEILSRKEFFNLLHSAANELPNLTICGNIIYCQNNWKTWYSYESRTYKIHNNNNYFDSGKISKALWGHNIDGSDPMVRLDYYDWTIDYCQITSIYDRESKTLIWDQFHTLES